MLKKSFTVTPRDRKRYILGETRDYIILAKHGFAVTRLEEWISNKKSQKGPRVTAEDKARKEIPLFLF